MAKEPAANVVNYPGKLCANNHLRRGVGAHSGSSGTDGRVFRAQYMTERAEREGLPRSDDTIVEASSGDTGSAMSMVTPSWATGCSS